MKCKKRGDLNEKMTRVLLWYLDKKYDDDPLAFYTVNGENIPYKPENFKKIAKAALIDQKADLLMAALKEFLAVSHFYQDGNELVFVALLTE